MIALMAALSPAAYGAARHLIGTKQLRTGAVTTSKLRAGAVKTGKLADGAVTSAKLAPGAIPAAPDLTGFARRGDSYTKAEADARFTPLKGLPARSTCARTARRRRTAIGSPPRSRRCPKTAPAARSCSTPGGSTSGRARSRFRRTRSCAEPAGRRPR